MLSSQSVEIVYGELSEDDLLCLFTSADIVVLPYTPESFAFRTSGLLIDSIYYGKPCVVVQGTWLGNIVEKFGCGVAIPKLDSDLLIDAVEVISSSYSDYRSRTICAGRHYFSNNSWELFVRSLLGTVTSCNTSSRVANLAHVSSTFANRKAYICRDDHYNDSVFYFSNELEIRHFAIGKSEHFTSAADKVWRFTSSNYDSNNFWFAVFKVHHGTLGNEYIGEIIVTPNQPVDVKLSLARFGDAPYEANSVQTTLVPHVKQKIVVRHQFTGQHSAIKVQIEILNRIDRPSFDFVIDTVGVEIADRCIEDVFCVQLNPSFRRVGLNQWVFVNSDSINRYWIATIGAPLPTRGNLFVGGLRLWSDTSMLLSISLARHGGTEYEGIARRIFLKPYVAQSIILEKRFEKEHASLKLQLEVLSLPEGVSALMRIDGLCLNESLAGI